MIIFFKFFPMVPPMKFFFILWYPKGSKKNWPKCHSGQSVSGQSVTLAKVSLWPKCHFGQNVTLAKVSLAKLSLQPNCLWPKCLWPKGHSGQSVILAKVSRPKCLWPKCHSGQTVIQPCFDRVTYIHICQKHTHTKYKQKLERTYARRTKAQARRA